MKPTLLLATEKGEIFDHPDYEPLGMERDCPVLISPKDLIPLPEGSKLFYIPNAIPLGLNKYGLVEEIKGFLPVAAFLPPGYTRLYLPAYKRNRKTPLLPLWSYTAVAWYKDRFYAASMKISWMRKADPKLHDDKEVLNRVKKFRENFPHNRLYRHLEVCALIYNCFAAKNVFLQRWEAPLPVSPTCNANCIGCLSKQSSECCPSQGRIEFVPDAEEVAQVAVNHLKTAQEAIVSFGQGCEGEPLLMWKTIQSAIRIIRSETSGGVINLNTNGSIPEAIEKLKKAGLDSIRISINSLSPERYNAYYNPKGYNFSDVLKSIRLSKEIGLFTSINYLTFPGYNDTEEEIERLLNFLKTCPVDLIQMRNLSIDPYLYMSRIPPPKGRFLGIKRLIKLIKKEFPQIKIGYFNLPKEALNGKGTEECYFI